MNGINICGVGSREKYKLLSYSGEEILSKDLQGPIECVLAPEVIGMRKGIAQIKLQFEGGTFYVMELPWGYELLEYSLGNK